MAAPRFRYRSLEDFVIASEMTVDGLLDNGWGAPMSIKGVQIDAAVLFAGISSFTERTAEMSPVETLTYVNQFFTWMTAEALNEGHGIIDKYIGDQVMVVYSKAFGSEDPFKEAVRAAVRMSTDDVMDFGPHIGIAEGPVIVGYAGTPVRHICSVFGAPVALAARCAGVPPDGDPDAFANHTITFPAESATGLAVPDLVAHLLRDPEAGDIEEDDTGQSVWKLTEPFTRSLKGRGEMALQQLRDDLSLRINSFIVEDRTRDSVEHLRRANRYWPNGRQPQKP